MPQENIFLIILIWLSTFLMGLVSWPSATFFFSRLSDKGYSIAKIFGWLVISYLAFVLATFKVLPLQIGSLVLLFLIWLGFNYFLQSKLRLIKKEAVNWNQILLIEIFFLILLFFWVFVRSHNPEIQGIERFMDFGFLNSLFQANSLPLYDFWFLGKNVNYYYFGHFLGYVILSLSQISPLPGFLLLVGWLFALLGINVYRLGRDLLSLLLNKVKENILRVAGLISFFSVMLAGTWYMYLWLFQKFQQLFFEGPPPYFWYPDATRIIPFAITEMPVYGFLEADLHPHIWGLLIGILVLTILYTLWQDEKYRLNLKNPYFWFLSFILGVGYMTNSWDALTLGMLSLFIIFFKFWLAPKNQLLKVFVFIAGAAYLFALPWSLFYHLPIAGLGFVTKRSPFLPWLSFWGFFLSLIVLFLAKIILVDKKTSLFHFALILAVIFFLLFMEIFYIKDLFQGGDYFRVNTVFKVSNQLWLWMGVLSGSMVTWLFFSLRKWPWKVIFLLVFILIFLGPAIYPVKTIWQARLENKKPDILSQGLNWWQKKYPFDYEAYLFLEKIKQSLPKNDKVRNIVEAEGESFTDFARFSTFLGWPTIIGWPIHEWTWRGTYDVVAPRVAEVKEIYTGKERRETENILKKYQIDYIIVGQLEKERYGEEINLDKLLSLGETIFDNEGTLIIQTK